MITTENGNLVVGDGISIEVVNRLILGGSSYEDISNWLNISIEDINNSLKHNTINTDEKELKNSTNWNYNRAAALDIKTLGPDPATSDIIQICIWPLSNRLELSRVVTPFFIDMIPVKLGYGDDVNLMGTGTSKSIYERSRLSKPPQVAADLFIEWVEKNKLLLEGRKLLPLTYNWHTKKSFLINWLGWKNFNYYFDYRVRDLLSIANFINDVADNQIQQVPIPKVDFAYICSSLKINHPSQFRKANCLQLCYCITQCYRECLRKTMVF